MKPITLLQQPTAELRAQDRFGAALPQLIAGVAREAGTSDVVSRIARSFVFLLGARTARVYLTGADERTLYLVASQNAGAAAQPASVGIDDARSPAACAVRLGLMQLVDASEARAFGRAPGPAGSARMRDCLAFAMPLFAGTATVGAVSADFDDLSPKDCSALGTLCDSLGAILDRARLRARVECLEARLQTRDEARGPISEVSEVRSIEA